MSEERPSLGSLFDGDLSDPPDSDEESGPRKKRLLDEQCTSDEEEDSGTVSRRTPRKLQNVPIFPPELGGRAKTDRGHLGLLNHASAPGRTPAFVSSAPHPQLQLAPSAQVQSRALYEPPPFNSIKATAQPDPLSPTNSNLKRAHGVLDPALGQPSPSTRRRIDAETLTTRPKSINASTTTVSRSESSR